jgi:putative hydrolase of the HAD superfamily
MAAPVRTIGFDADDTLWHNEVIFEQTHERYRALLARFHDAATVDRILLEVEVRNLELYGYGIKGFTLSAIEAAIELSEGRISSTEISQLLALGREMLAHPVALLDGVVETITQLSPNHRLLMITKGDLRDQERKVAKSGLADHFRHVEIVSEKDASTYRRLFQRHSIDPREFLMVGNSIKSDILPVLELGGYGVHIPYRLTWAVERAEAPINHDGRFFTIHAMNQLPTILNRWANS